MSSPSAALVRGIAASWVVPGEGEPLRAGAVVLDAAGVVLGVGSAEAMRAAHPDADWSVHDAVLLPGLVNAHTHLELSALRGRVPGGQGFVPWLEALYAASTDATPDVVEAAIEESIGMLVASGTAAVGEVTNTLAAVASLGTAPLVACVFHEIYGVGLDAARRALDEARAARTAFASWPLNARHALAPHGPHSLHPEVLREVAAEARGVRTSMHLCEHAAERRFLASGDGPFAEFLRARGASTQGARPSGTDPVRTARALGALGPHVLAVHLCDARDDEVGLVAEAGSPVVLCPRSNLHIHVKLPPLPKLLAAGVRPGLGTDSLASSPSLDVLDEAATLRARFPGVPAGTLVSMATAWGADALGLGDRLGRIVAGRAPGLLAFRHAGPAPDDPCAWLLSRARGAPTVLSPPCTDLAVVETVR